MSSLEGNNDDAPPAGRSTGRNYYWSPSRWWSESPIAQMAPCNARNACCAGKEVNHAEVQTELPREYSPKSSFGSFSECVLIDPLEDNNEEPSPSLRESSTTHESNTPSTSDRDEASDEADEESGEDEQLDMMQVYLRQKEAMRKETKAMLALQVSSVEASARQLVTLGDSRELGNATLGSSPPLESPGLTLGEANNVDSPALLRHAAGLAEKADAIEALARAALDADAAEDAAQKAEPQAKPSAFDLYA